MSIKDLYPTNSPSVLFDFKGSRRLDPRISFTRNSIATIFNVSGKISVLPANYPRFDFDTTTLVPKGILIEESRTNIFLDSEFSNVATTTSTNQWYDPYADFTVTSNYAVSPSGETDAALIQTTSSTSSRPIWYRTASTTAGTYVYSVYCKANATDLKVRLLLSGESSITNYVRADYTLSGSGTAVLISATGTAVSPSAPTIQSVGNGWYRCVLHATLTSPTNISALIYPGTVASQTTESQTLVWGAQLELGSFVTSYIPTTTQTVTREADTLNINDYDSWYNTNSNTIFVELESMSPLTAAQSIALFKYPHLYAFEMGSSDSAIFWYGVNADLYIGGTYNSLGSISSGNNKLAISQAFTGGQSRSSLNGATAVNRNGNLSGTSPTRVRIGTDGTSTPGVNQYLNGWIRKLSMYPNTTSATMLQTLTI